MNTYGAPSLITRITNDVQQVQMLVLMTCTLLVAAPITCIGGIVMALREDTGLSWILTVSIPVLVISVGTVISRMVPQFRKMQDRIDAREPGPARADHRHPRRAGLRARARRERRFAAPTTTSPRSRCAPGDLQAFMFPTVMLILNLSSSAVIWIGAHRIADGEMQIGALIAFLSYLAQILMAVMMATFMAVLVPRASVCADRIQEVLDTPSSVVTAPTPVAEVTEHGELELRNVGFRYPGADEPVLSGITLHASNRARRRRSSAAPAPARRRCSASIPRLFDATEGAVAGRRRRRPRARSGHAVDPHRPRAPEAVPVLRHGGHEPAPRPPRRHRRRAVGRRWRSPRPATSCRTMPGGLDAPIVQGGTNVSGGQRQRLAIARALVRRPEIYLFDDSFSALDLATDARLRAALAPHTREATVLIVAQRISTIMNADQILVLEDGIPVGLGTHASCWRRARRTTRSSPRR